MATLGEMYCEERAHRGVRAAIRAVAQRTGNAPAYVARELGFHPDRLPMGPVVMGPGAVSEEGLCNACNDAGPGAVFSVHARGMSMRLCPGCAEELAGRLLTALEAAR